MTPFVLLGDQSRANHANYPVFSIRKDNIKLNGEFKDLLNSNNIAFEQLLLPGILSPETGYAIKFELIKGICKLEMSEELKASFMAWTISPKNTLLPDYNVIPEYCVKPVSYFYRDNFKWTTPDIIKSQIQNVITGDRAEIYFNYTAKEITISNAEAWNWQFIMVIDVGFDLYPIEAK